MRIERWLDEMAGRCLREALDLEAPAVLRPTQDAKHGDYQINAALPLAKQLKRPPREIAQAIADRLGREEAVEGVEVAGPGFVNLRLADGWLGARLGEALADRERDGVPEVAEQETVVVDFSSPNVAKQMHVGHLRSTIIGDALQRMLRFVGHRVIGDNHLGDWGTQFGLLIVGMRRFGDDEALSREPIVELERVYKLAAHAAKEDEAFADEARRELAKLQQGDPDNRALWQRFVDTTRASLDAIYARLDVHFDTWLGESAYHDALPGVVELLLEKGIAREDQGAICVFFADLPNAPKNLQKQEVPFIVRKKDGAFLYSTTDIATVFHRKRELGADRALYVVDARQGPHFQQLFAVSQALGIEIALEHVGFGMVLGKDNKPLKTRDLDGKTITLASLLDEAEERAERLMKEEVQTRLDGDALSDLAKVIGIGAVKYADLSQHRTSNYQFDWDKLITLKGNASPYLQYAHARVQSIFDKGGIDATSLAGPLTLEAPEEAVLARRLIRFGEVVHQATEHRLPHLLCDHLYLLARDYSSFFTECPVLKSEGTTRDSRLALCDLTARQLRRGLGLLGIAAPDRM